METESRMPDWLSQKWLSEKDKISLDEEVRSVMKIPSNRYYTVQTYPASRLGIVRVERERVVHSKKISKSDS